jgi:hypothetical protein
MKKIKKNKTRKTRNTRKTRKTRKTRNTKRTKISKKIILKSKTPSDILKLSREISSDLSSDLSLGKGIRDLISTKISTKKSSYSPSINKDLITLKSIPREKIEGCNNKLAFQLKEPLRIMVSGDLFGKECVKYNDHKAKKFLLKNLSANKHIMPSNVVPPIQNQSNCWFNTMFVALFVSDKGRKFFHYFRQLMIEGKQFNGSHIPHNLRDAFALLNFAIESSLTGNKYAYELDTNNIIKQIYASIPDEYKKSMPYVVKVDQASNPIRYYNSIINYLGNNDLHILFVSNISTAPNWKEKIKMELMNSSNKKPHIIVLEIFDSNNSSGHSGEIVDKETQFNIEDLNYKLDSCIVRDIEQQHFCATVTVENQEMAYDGMSFHRMVPMKWKDLLNKNDKWTFEGSTNLDESNLEWSFLHGYQMLIYYRI